MYLDGGVAKRNTLSEIQLNPALLMSEKTEENNNAHISTNKVSPQEQNNDSTSNKDDQNKKEVQADKVSAGSKDTANSKRSRACAIL